MILEIVHDTTLLEVVANVDVWPEDGQIFCEIEDWKVEGVRMPLSALPEIMAQELEGIAAEEFRSGFAE